MVTAKRYRSLTLSVLLLFGLCTVSHAQKSIIELLLTLQDSVVEIEAGGVQMYRIGNRAVRAVGHVRHGAGIIVSPDGLILTNAHVAYQKGHVTVRLSSGATHPARLAHVSPQNDVVFLKIENLTTPLAAVALGNSDQLKLRDKIYTIGSSQTTKNSLSEGQVTGLGSMQKGAVAGADSEMLQMSFNVYEGDSGSPVFNEDGELVGMITASRRKAGRTSYAVSSNLIKQYIEQIN